MEMNPWIVLAWVVTAGSVAGLVAGLGWAWFSSRSNAENDTGDTRPGFSLERYQVMNRLLSARDLQFLAAQPGVTANRRARWKRDSVRIFRRYLSELTRDFQTLHAQARRLVAESRSESPELASTLVHQQAAFWRARIILEGRLLMFAFGIGAVNVAPLLQLIDAMRMDLRRMVPEPAAAP
jgi:hypothetical protein